MNRLQIFFSLITVFVVLFTSCSIEKRVHLPGFYLSQNKSTQLKETLNKTQSNTTNLLSDKLNINKTDRIDENLLASASNELILPPPTLNKTQSQNKKTNIQYVKNNQLDNECDIIFLKNGDEIKAKVLEIGVAEIKYVNCDNRSGPTFVILKKDVFMIKYPNGTKTVFNDEKAENKKQNSNSDPYLQTIDSDDKSFVIAVVLWFFLGLLGVHRMYLGHIGIGILYLLTGGLCGIGWVVDGILFLTGDLKPRNGKYIDL